jgi:biotin carboxyl carrier protein
MAAGWAHARHEGTLVKYYARVGDNEYEVEIREDAVYLDGELLDVDLHQSGAPELYSVLFNGRSYELLIEAERFHYGVSIRGDRYDIRVEDERQRRTALARGVPDLPEGEAAVTAPIPGLVVKIMVEEGDVVVDGQPLVILEAMKMENEIRATRSGTVKQVHAVAGQRIEEKGLLLIVE